MKKMIFALVAMVMMTMSANAQSDKNVMTFDRLASYLELTTDQIEPMKTAMMQFERSMESYYQLEDASKGAEAWGKIQTRHNANMKRILSEKQYDKYEEMFNLTAKNTADRIIEQQTASK